MTRKDYVVIASALLSLHREGIIGKRIITEVALTLANYLKKNNPRFDKSKFVEACGL